MPTSNLIFQLEVVFRYRDSQHQIGENYVKGGLVFRRRMFHLHVQILSTSEQIRESAL